MKAVVAYSGGLDTSVILRWLRLKYKDWHIIAFYANLGQIEDQEKIKERALYAGADEVILKDLREEFLLDFAFPALQAEAHYQNYYLLSSALSRPLIAKYLVEISKNVGAEKIIHGCSGRGNDQIRFELSIRLLADKFEILAPLRIWEFKSREEEIEFAKKEGIIGEEELKKRAPYSIDENLWGKSIECGPLEDISKAPTEDIFFPINHKKNSYKEIEISFDKGKPVAINSEVKPPLRLVEELTKIGKEYCIGRVDMIEDRAVGIKTRELYEAPSTTLLYFAHHDLEALVLDPQLRRFKAEVAMRYGELIYQGLWYTQLREALDAFVQKTQERVIGKVKLRLYPYSCMVVSRDSPYSRYKKGLASYEEDFYLFKDPYTKGFIDFLALPYR